MGDLVDVLRVDISQLLVKSSFLSAAEFVVECKDLLLLRFFVFFSESCQLILCGFVWQGSFI